MISLLTISCQQPNTTQQNLGNNTTDSSLTTSNNTAEMDAWLIPLLSEYLEENSIDVAIDITGNWNMVITKSDGVTNYANVTFIQNIDGSFEGRMVFTNISTNDGLITGNTKTGDFIIQEIGGTSSTTVEGSFSNNTYSGTYITFYSSGRVNTGVITMTRAPISVNVSPQEFVLERNETHTFSATVAETNNKAVSWSSTCGTIDSNGVYVAPNIEGICTITATSLEDPTKNAIATVTVTGVVITLSPSLIALNPNESQNFIATIEGTANTSVSWEATGGIINTNGNSVLYTAPLLPSIYTLTAKSIEDPSKKAEATIVIKSNTEPVDWALISNWFTYQANESHTGYVPVTLNSEKFVHLWSRHFDSSISSISDGNNQVFVSFGGAFNQGDKILYALNASTGATNWEANLGEREIINPPAYANEKVYVVTGGHENSFIWGFNEDSNTAILNSSYGNQWSTYYAPTPHQGSIYMAGGYYGGSYAFDGSSGNQVWFNDSYYLDDLWTPTVDDLYIYAYSQNTLRALDRLTGQLSYSISVPNTDFSGYNGSIAPMKISQNKIIIIDGKRLISFDLENRVASWNLKANYTGQPAYANETIYAINDGNIEARAVETGSLLWKWIPLVGNASGTMVVTDNLLFVNVDTKTIAIDLTSHQPVWEYPIKGELALANEGLLYISDPYNRNLVAIDVR